MQNAKTIDDYIALYPAPVRKMLKTMRAAIRAAAPAATEAIKYGLPTLVLNGNLVHFGAFKQHIGFYPAPSGLDEFSKELAPYKRSKGSLHFPLDRPLPVALIKRIVKFRVKQNMQNKTSKAK